MITIEAKLSTREFHITKYNTYGSDLYDMKPVRV